MELKTYFAQDRAGNVVPNATVTIYLTGTNTLATGLKTVADASLANPFTANADGKIQFKAADGVYDMQIAYGSQTGARVTFQCIDAVTQIATAQAAATTAVQAKNDTQAIIDAAGDASTLVVLAQPDGVEKVGNAADKRQFPVSPYDMGYTGGNDDYGYFLQLALNTGRDVFGGPSKATVKAFTVAKINNSSQHIDLSMISVEWLGDYDLYGTVADRTIGFISAHGAGDLGSAVTATSMPVEDSNTIAMPTGHGFLVGDFVQINADFPTRTGDSRVATVVSVSEISISLDYAFGFAPDAITVQKINSFLSGLDIKPPSKITDNSGSTVDRNCICGVGLKFVKDSVVHGFELINGAYPALIYKNCAYTQDIGVVTTKPRLTTGGRGYAVQCIGSFKLKSLFANARSARHVIDWSGSSHCESISPHASNMTTAAITTHGQYEHDIVVRNGFHIGSDWSFSIGDSGVEFGQRTKRFTIDGGNYSGRIRTGLFTESTNIINNARLLGAGEHLLSPAGGVLINAEFNPASTMQIQSQGGAGIYKGIARFESCKLPALIDMRAGLTEFHVCGGSILRDVKATTSAKPDVFSVTGNTKWIMTNGGGSATVGYTDFTVNNIAYIGGNTEIDGGALVTAFIRGPKVILDSGVNVLNSTGIWGYATEEFKVACKFSRPSSDRAADMIRLSTASSKFTANSAHIEFLGTGKSISAVAVTGVTLNVQGCYIEGLTGLIQATNVTRAIVANNIVKDDFTLRSQTTAGVKVYQNNIY